MALLWVGPHSSHGTSTWEVAILSKWGCSMLNRKKWIIWSSVAYSNTEMMASSEAGWKGWSVWEWGAAFIGFMQISPECTYASSLSWGRWSVHVPDELSRYDSEIVSGVFSRSTICNLVGSCWMIRAQWWSVRNDHAMSFSLKDLIRETSNLSMVQECSCSMSLLYVFYLFSNSTQ